MNPAVALPDFRALYDAELGYVLHTLRRLNIPDRALEDVAHDVFCVVHRRLADFDTTRPLKPWLFGICFRVAHDVKRKASNREVPTDNVGVDTPVDTDSGKTERYMRHAEARRWVWAAVRSLSEEQQAVFILHDLDETPMPEVALALDVPLNTAYSRLRLARVAVEKSLRAHAHLSGDAP